MVKICYIVCRALTRPSGPPLEGIPRYRKINQTGPFLPIINLASVFSMVSNLQRCYQQKSRCNMPRIGLHNNSHVREGLDMHHYHAQIPVDAKAGEYARFTALGQFLRMESYLSNGIGLIFQVQADGTLRRVFF